MVPHFWLNVRILYGRYSSLPPTPCWESGAAVVNDGLDLKIMQRPAALQRGEAGRLNEVAALLAAGDARDWLRRLIDSSLLTVRRWCW